MHRDLQGEWGREQARLDLVMHQVLQGGRGREEEEAHLDLVMQEPAAPDALVEEEGQQPGNQDHNPGAERVPVLVIRHPHHALIPHVVDDRQRGAYEYELHHRVVPAPTDRRSSLGFFLLSACWPCGCAPPCALRAAATARVLEWGCSVRVLEWSALSHMLLVHWKTS